MEDQIKKRLLSLLPRRPTAQAATPPSEVAGAAPRGFWPWLLLSTYAALVIVRAPTILLEGRFWAEEGSVFFVHACRNGWFDALVAVDGKHGYFSLLNNLAALLASRLTGLDHAPLVTAWTAFAVQLVPASLLAFGMVRELRPLPMRALSLSALLFVRPNSEVWLTTVSGQFHLAVTTMLILASDLGDGWGRHVKRGLLAFAALSGPLTLFVLPLFWLRAWQEKARERIVQAAILTGLGLVQVIVVIAALGEGPRRIAFPVDIFALVVLAKAVLLPVLGSAWTVPLAVPLTRQAAIGQAPWWPVALVVLGIGLLALLIAKSRSRNAATLVAAAGLLLVLSFATAAEQGNREMLSRHILPMGAERYYFAPNALLFLGSLAAVGAGSRLAKLGQRIVGALLLACLLLGGIDYARSATLQPWNFTGPRWSDELAKARHNPQYPPRLWPANWRLPAPPIGICGR